MSFAEVILPLPLKTTFTYAVNKEMAGRVVPGSRVVVPFGRKKFYTGIVATLSPFPPEGYEVKEIAMTLDDTPVLRHPQIKLWRWVSDYYMCAIGEVFKAAVPAGLKLESETFVELNPDYMEEADSRLSDEQVLIIQVLEHEGKRLTIGEIGRLSGLKRVSRAVGALLDKGAVIISERLVEKYRSKKEGYVKLTDPSAEGRAAAFKAVKGARKQENALLALLDLSGAIHGHEKEVSRKELMEKADVAPAILNAMVKKGVIEQYKKEINRFKYSGSVNRALPTLTAAQQTALDQIHRAWTDHGVNLLHGVTSSGKTEIYIHLIDYVLKQREQVLYLVPEIALTTQLSERLQRVFGDKVMVWHSKFSDNERVDLWRRLLELKGEPVVILGVRSAVFLPFDRLGLVIVDEEHDTSYKQQDPAPRYNGRDTAMVLASMHGAKTLLGSATPSVETYYKAVTGRYGLVSLTERYESLPLPEVRLVDMKSAKARGFVAGCLAAESRSLLSDALAKGNQGIIFLNRRGYAPMAVCRMCSHVPKCCHCDVALTYHRATDRLVCHYCGATYPLPTQCPVCKDHSIEIVGYGTERIEEELSLYFPDVPAARLDLDTTRSKDSYMRLIDEFSTGASRLLVGTQMVTKGLDFGAVSAVVVVNADAVLHYPDYRSAERAFNMIEQVAGRAGRRNADSVVAVQTFDTAHPVLEFARNHDYAGFYASEIAERERYGYPPFVRLLYVYLKNPDKLCVDQAAALYSSRLKSLLGSRVSGPEEPPVSRVKSLYIRRMMVKVEPEVSLAKVKQALVALYDSLMNVPEMKSSTIVFDVDPA